MKTHENEKPRDGLKALRDVLLRMRNDEQGGYSSYLGEGKWNFVSTSLSQKKAARK